jgi:electron transfer flavoprotein beta subunit
VLLTDRFFAGSDTLATSYALSMAIKKIGEMWGAPEVVFTGKQTIDGDTAQVGPGIARRLGLNQLTYVSGIGEVDLEAGTINVSRRAEGGVQKLSTRLPALITMLEGTSEIRRGRRADAVRAAEAEVTIWKAAGAGIEDLLKCGLRGSPTVVKQVFAPKGRANKVELIDTREKAAPELAAEMMAKIFGRLPGIEDDMLAHAAQY